MKITIKTTFKDYGLNDLLKEAETLSLSSRPDGFAETCESFINALQDITQLRCSQGEQNPATGTRDVFVFFNGDILNAFRDYLMACRTGDFDFFLIKHKYAPWSGFPSQYLVA